MVLLLDKNRQPIGPLEGALGLGVERNLNDLGTATLTMAAGDPQHGQIVVPSSWAHLWDGEEDLGLWRFAGEPEDDRTPLGKAQYQLQSGECTLLDDLLTGEHEVGGTGYSTRQVLQYILDHQTSPLWSLGTVAFADYYQYRFCDVTLLEAILSIGETLLSPYRFRFDTSAWKIHLEAIPQAASCSLTYARTMRSVRRSIDGRVVNRLYGRGYGEGDNQLTIRSVNAGRDYLDNAQSIARHGVRCGVHVDTRQQDPATLKAHMSAILAGSAEPGVSYEVDAIDLARSDGSDWDRVQVGERVLVLDRDLGPVSAIVSAKKKADVLGDPGNVVYTLDTQRKDTAEELNQLREKVGVHELYSQGATNMYSMQVMDNCDASKPLEMRFYVPKNVLRINACLLTWRMERFRTYTKQARSGGGSTRTSSEGGGATISYPSLTTEVYLSTINQLDEEGEGYPKPTTDATSLTTREAEATSGHTHSIWPHTHGMRHVHMVRGGVQIPAMSFNLSGHSHSVSVPSHSHEIEYGVFEAGGNASSLSVYADGNLVPGGQDSGRRGEVDVAAYLSKDADGKVQRGTWHTIRFTPSGNARIVADLFFQVFIQSRGAGDY